MKASASSLVAPASRRPVQRAYTAMLLVYWLLLYTSSTSDEVERGSLLYLLYVAPVLLFAGVFAIPTLMRRELSLPVGLLVGYAALVLPVALLRADSATFTSTLLMTLVLVVIAGERVAPSHDLLNLIFLASIPLSLATYLVGTNIYGIVPGLGLDEALRWRISLFPVVPESAFFSALVLCLNLLDRHRAWRRTCIVLAIYFLVFSGLRSALIGMLLALAYHVATSRGWVQRPPAKMFLLGGVTLMFVASLLLSQLLVFAPALGNEFLNVYLFRSEGGIESDDDVTRTVYRTWLWSEHFRIAADNPLLGIGTHDFAALADVPAEFGGGSGSESFLTGLYARVGLPSLLFVAFFVASLWRQVRMHNELPCLVALLLVVAMLAYGSFLVPYNFAFLVMVGLLGARPRTPEALSARASTRRMRRPVPVGGSA